MGAKKQNLIQPLSWVKLDPDYQNRKGYDPTCPACSRAEARQGAAQTGRWECLPTSTSRSCSTPSASSPLDRREHRWGQRTAAGQTEPPTSQFGPTSATTRPTSPAR